MVGMPLGHPFVEHLQGFRRSRKETATVVTPGQTLDFHHAERGIGDPAQDVGQHAAGEMTGRVLRSG